MNKQELKARLQSLYDDLKAEAEVKVTTCGNILPLSQVSYYKKAESLIKEAVLYSQIDEDFAINHLIHTFDKEVKEVYNYDGKGKSLKERNSDLESKMRRATYQLYLDLCSLVSD